MRVLATSRESLRLPGETVYAVAPLEPDDAARLFTERAVAAAPDFAPASDSGIAAESDDESGEVRDAVAEICRRLDGLPLALELAATRVRALGVRELAERLGDRFRVLASGQRGLPARQQTLRAVIDWSWDLLAPPEQAVLRRLAVPVGGCTPAAAETVCAGDGIAHDDVLDLVGRLVDRSLVSTVRTADGPRYRLLESVAAYARERLHEAGESGVVTDRHAVYYREFAERAEDRLRGAGQRHRSHSWTPNPPTSAPPSTTPCGRPRRTARRVWPPPCAPGGCCAAVCTRPGVPSPWSWTPSRPTRQPTCRPNRVCSWLPSPC